MLRRWWREWRELVLIFGLIFVAMAVTLTIWILDERKLRRECRESGGRVVEVHGGRGSWFCESR